MPELAHHVHTCCLTLCCLFASLFCWFVCFLVLRDPSKLKGGMFCLFGVGSFLDCLTYHLFPRLHHDVRLFGALHVPFNQQKVQACGT